MRRMTVKDLILLGPAAFAEPKRRGRPSKPAKSIRQLFGLRKRPGPTRREWTKPTTLRRLAERLPDMRRSAEYQAWLKKKTYRDSDKAALRYEIDLFEKMTGQKGPPNPESVYQALVRYRRASVARSSRKSRG